MTEPGSDRNDDELLAELRAAAARTEAVPPEALAAARSAFAWRTMDAELAELTGAGAGAEELALIRSTDLPTLLTFEGAGLTVEVEVARTGEGRRLLGRVMPPQRGQVEVRHAGGRLDVPVDALGRFSAGDVRPGPASLRFRAGEEADARVVETDWFLA